MMNNYELRNVNEYHLPPNTTDMDFHVYSCFYNEIFLDKEYDRYGICVEPNDTVLDAGANIGIFTNYALSRYAGKILSIECDDVNYECLTQNTIDDRVKHLKGYVSGNDTENLDSYNLSKILKTFGVDKIDFAKIDIEGYEYDFLLNASDDEINCVDKWAIEVHYIFDQKCAQNVLNILDKFSRNNYLGYYSRIHLNTNLGMLYFKKTKQ